MSKVRVHKDARAAETTQMLGARAITIGPHIFLGRGEKDTDLPLMAHEAAHTVQQRGAPRVQLWTQSSTDRYEHEAQRASTAVVSRQSFHRHAADDPARAAVRDQRSPRLVRGQGEQHPGLPHVHGHHRRQPDQRSECSRARGRTSCAPPSSSCPAAT